MAEVTRRRGGIDIPRGSNRTLRPSVDTERFGRLSENVARYIGSWAFIAWMTVAIVAWIALNLILAAGAPDPFPFIFLTLLLSLQASYAAPLILLAQNRQADRDRVQFQEDRARTERLLADSDYLAREIAALRLALGDVATRDYVRTELRDQVDEIIDRLDQHATEQRRVQRKSLRRVERRVAQLANETDDAGGANPT